MTLLSAYKAATPMKASHTSWVKEVTEPHLPKGWTKYFCMKNGKKIHKLVQYRDLDGKKYKSLKAVEDYLSQIIIRNNWQNVAPWNDFLKKMLTDKNQKESFKIPNPRGRPRKVKSSSSSNLLSGPPTQTSFSPSGPPYNQSSFTPSGPPYNQPSFNPSGPLTQTSFIPSGLTTQTSFTPSEPPTLTSFPIQPSLNKNPSKRLLPGLPTPFLLSSGSDVMVTNHFRARRPPGPPSPASAAQPPLSAELIKLEPEDIKEEPTDLNSPTLEIAVPPAKDLVLPKIDTVKITPVNLPSDNVSQLITDISKETSKKFQCSVCHQIFEDKATLVKHLTVHQQCNICNALYKTKGTLLKHIEVAHKNESRQKNFFPNLNKAPTVKKEDFQEVKNNSKVGGVPMVKEIQKKENYPELNKVLTTAVKIESDAMPDAKSDDKLVSPQKISNSLDVADEKKEIVVFKGETSPILSENQLDVNRKRLTSIGDVLAEDQNEIELSFSKKSSEETDLNESDEIIDGSLNSSNLMLEESLDNSIIVLEENAANHSDTIKEHMVPEKDVIVEERDGNLVNAVNKADNNSMKKEPGMSNSLVKKARTDKTLKWFDGIFYTCNFASGSNESCGRNFVGRKPFRFHLGHHHGLKLKTNELNGLKAFASKHQEGTYRCKSCMKLVRHDEFGISHHLLKTHALSIDSYAMQFEKVHTKVPAEDPKGEVLSIQRKSEVVIEDLAITRQKTKLKNQIVTFELQLKDNEGHIEELNYSKLSESEKIVEDSKQVEFHKSELFKRIAAIEMEKDDLLKKVGEYNEVISENLNQIAKIEQVNNNRMSVLQNRSKEILDNIVKTKTDFEALLVGKVEHEEIIDDSSPMSDLQKSILLETKQSDAVMEDELSTNVESKGIKPDTNISDKDENPNVENDVAAEKEDTKEESAFNEERKQSMTDSKSTYNEKPREKGSALENKIKALKRKSAIDVTKDGVIAETSPAASLPKYLKSELDKKEIHVDSSKEETSDVLAVEDLMDKHVKSKSESSNVEDLLSKGSEQKKRGRKKLSDEEKAARKSVMDMKRDKTSELPKASTEVHGIADNIDDQGEAKVDVNQPKKRGRKKLSDEEKASRKAIRIESKLVSIAKPVVNTIENGFVFQDVEKDIPRVPCLPVTNQSIDQLAGETGKKDSHNKSENLAEGSGKHDLAESFQNVQDSMQKSKKKMQQDNTEGDDPQRVVRDLSDLFAEIDEESNSAGEKGEIKTAKLKMVKIAGRKSNAKKEKSKANAPSDKVGEEKKKSSKKSRNLQNRRSIHMSNGNVDGAESIENIAKQGRNSL